MTVRRAKPEDALAIAHVGVQSWQKAYAHILPPEKLASLDVNARAERWRSRLTNELEEHVWVGQDGHRVVGFVAAALKEDEPCSGEWFIGAIYLYPKSQGKGFGRLLLQEAIEEGLRLGYPSTVLSVFTENHAARAFYAKCGGEEFLDSTWPWEGDSYPVVYVRFTKAP